MGGVGPTRYSLCGTPSVAGTASRPAIASGVSDNGGEMSSEENKALTRYIFEELNKGTFIKHARA